MAFQQTFDGQQIPIKKSPERKLTPGSVAWKIYNYLRTSYVPLTQTRIQAQFPEHTVGNRLRELRKWGYAKDRKLPNGQQEWRAIH